MIDFWPTVIAAVVEYYGYTREQAERSVARFRQTESPLTVRMSPTFVAALVVLADGKPIGVK